MKTSTRGRISERGGSPKQIAGRHGKRRGVGIARRRKRGRHRCGVWRTAAAWRAGAVALGIGSAASAAKLRSKNYGKTRVWREARMFPRR